MLSDSRTRGPGFECCYLPTVFKSTGLSKICLVSVHSEKSLEEDTVVVSQLVDPDKGSIGPLPAELLHSIFLSHKKQKYSFKCVALKL